MPTPPSSGVRLLSKTQLAKQEIRLRVLAMRDALSKRGRTVRSRRIAQRIAALPSFVDVRTVLLFHSFGSEWRSEFLIQEALWRGKTVVLPRVLKWPGQMVLQTIENIVRDTAPSKRGILEPLPERPTISPEAIDWILVPGVAFTPRGDRLGYGGGFYDRLLAQLSPQVPRLAGAFEIQIVETLPTAHHDCSVDAVYTERRVFHCNEQKGFELY
ncbi:MAG: 5-formyltetrahydrofolate cyclo-ligase [Betaproteobacteria bacterium]|nr:5-formyltetrahydrofolate cyclo-ligase [Betaproteobacteria bacterium]